MDFIPPYDQIGVNPPGPWTNASPQAGIQGSIPNANFFPAVQDEILNVQDEAGQVRDATNHVQLLHAIRSGKLTYFPDAGSADALVVTPRTSFPSLAAGLRVVVLKGASPNATATPTLTLGGPALPLVKEDGTALAAGDLPAGCLFEACSDGAHFRVLGLRKSTVASLFSISDTQIWHIGTLTGGPTAYATTLNPVPSAAANGLCMRVLVNAVNGANPTLDFGFGAKSVVLNATGLALAGKEMSGWADLIYNAAAGALELMNPSNVAVIPQSAASVTATYGMAADQGVASNVYTDVALTGGTTAFSAISGATITIQKAGIYFLSAVILANTVQPSGELQYASLIILKNGAVLTQTSQSAYSFGSSLIAENVGTAAFFGAGDTIKLQFYTHSQNNDDHNDVISAGGTSLTLTKVV